MILKSKHIVENIENKIIKDLTFFDYKPTLAIIIIGDNIRSKTYIKIKIKKAEKLGIKTKLVSLKKDVLQEDVLSVIHKLNNDESITGIIVQLPLSNHIVTKDVLDSISSSKDVDALSSFYKEQIYLNNFDYLPATPTGVIELIKNYDIDVENKKIAVIGSSDLVGKPIYKYFSTKSKHVKNYNSQTGIVGIETADIIISATGAKHLLNNSNVKHGAVIIDIGITIKDGEQFGDANFQELKETASYISPTKGGVGPLTVVSIFTNLIKLMNKKINIL